MQKPPVIITTNKFGKITREQNEPDDIAYLIARIKTENYVKCLDLRTRRSIFVYLIGHRLSTFEIN